MDQQAPPDLWHSALVEVQWLSIRAQLTKGGITCQSKYMTTMVIRELYQVLNRLALIQPTTPILMAGGLRFV